MKSNHGFYLLVESYVALSWPFQELMDHPYAWVEVFHALFVIKVRSNLRSPFRWARSNGCQNLSRLVPVGLSELGAS